MWAEYKAFLFRGNLIDIAVAFILGVAFSAVVTAFTDGVVMNLVAAVVGQPSFDSVVVTLNGTDILVGTFFTALVNFALVAAAMFMIVKAASRFTRAEPEEVPTPDTDEVVILREIRDALLERR